MTSAQELNEYRASVTSALFDRLTGLEWHSSIIGESQSFQEVGRRVKLFSDNQLKPSMFLCKTGEIFQPRSETDNIRTMKFDLIIYHDTAKHFPECAPSDESDAILSAIEDALQPLPPDFGYPTRNTLGDLVHSVKLDGEANLDHGDIDGEGMLRIPIIVVLP